MLIGYQIAKYPFIDAYPASSGYPRLVYYGGFGYGVNYDGAIAGGFGFAIMDVAGESGIAGGVGGFLSGIRLIESPLNISIKSWTALLEACVDELRSEGIRKCHVFVYGENAAGNRFWAGQKWAERIELKIYSREIDNG